MDRIVVGAFTVRHLAIAGACLVGLILLIGVLVKVFGRKREDPHTQAVICSGCGWKGRVSTYAGRCPKCNQPLGARKAVPPRAGPPRS